MTSPAMILTLTPNPSLDRAFDVADLEVGEVNRALRSHLDAGGKGINISRALALHGIDTAAVFPCGGPDGALLVNELTAANVRSVPLPIQGAIRSNITIVDGDGRTTKINAPGPTLSENESAALLAAIDDALATGPSWLAAAGSLPAGLSPDFYSNIAESAARHGVPMALDSSGAALALAARGGNIALLKPNDDELAELLGRELLTVGDVVSGSRQVMSESSHGIGALLVSLGSRGALLINDRGHWWAGGPRLVPLSTVGAGDTTLAGFLSVIGDPATAEDDELSHALCTAVAWGRAAVLLPGSAAPGPHQIDTTAVRVVATPELSLPLKELLA